MYAVQSLNGKSASLFDGADELLNEFVVRFVRRKHDTVEAATHKHTKQNRIPVIEMHVIVSLKTVSRH